MVELLGLNFKRYIWHLIINTEALIKTERIMKSLKFQLILAQNLQASARKLKMKRNFTFQQNHNPKHASKSP